ncbi:MAG: tripartite tricarboxylate transporter substrate binding protein [Pigmentiphaga sp.]|uniref:Bug family tripartite tricarboxylate transporter substrate binding protein n=1 Tax=Pigmentiphaga sp. TaxID=1977564 RepID=UPI0029BB0426|nr:tripartite tricarboxylate transporter substrate binding protein [Pigmentiphaga sp.]MDX3904623.1 tripartite tricarboxylate transporter substrate binding protein [Pigmentiphaga sp.]
MHISRKFLAPAAMLLGAMMGTAAHAEDYPSRPVRIVIPFAPGGSNDIVGRLIGEELSKRLAQPFIVDNRGGAGGTIGTELVAKSRPDGYTLLLISTPHTANSTLYKKLPYDPVKDFEPIARIGTAPLLISVYPGLPVKTLSELIAYAKANPGKLNYVSSGVGSSQHLVSELFEIRAGISMTHVPYKGAGAALADVAAGHAQVSVGTVLQALPHVKANRLRPLAVSGGQRQPVVPDVPTVEEAGLAGYDGDNWWGVLAPAGTPRPIVDKLSKAIADILADPDMRRRLEAESATVAYLAPAPFGEFLTSETAKWAELIKRLGIQAD